MPPDRPPIVILGAGINGAAIARELLLHRVPVVVVDRADVSSGATAYSSRLIHGGLRYFEYGEFDLVRESLAERTRLLRLAPQFVRPLRLWIPARRRWGGFGDVLRRWLFRRSPNPATPRGQWLIRLGLWLYDRYAADPAWPRHTVQPAAAARRDDAAPPVAEDFRWLCSFFDGQISFPERFVVALLEDARRLAAEAHVELRVLTYHEARLIGDEVEVRALNDSAAPPAFRGRPAAIINATGAWVDRTLARLEVPERQLIGGTKGSHLFTFHPALRAALAGGGLYVEASDGRPVFILPLNGGTLIGTTDIPFEGDPADATAGEDELEYLLAVVNGVLPSMGLQRADVAFHYSGVRPLPYVGAASPAGITRRHWLEQHRGAAAPLYSVIGGKLTTCRSLAESTAQTVLERLGWPTGGTSQARPLPGGEEYPADAMALAVRQRQLAAASGLPIEQVAAVWRLLGTQAEHVLPSLGRSDSGSSRTRLAGTDYPRSFVRWVIEHEWVTTLDDLVERRLMLLYEPDFSAATLHDLVQLLVECGKLRADGSEAAIEASSRRLAVHYGKHLPRSAV